MTRVFCLIGLLVFASTTIVEAQSNPNFQLWTDFNPRVRLTEQFKIVGDIGYRIEPESSAQTFLIRGAARYSPNHILSFDLGLGEFITWNNQVFNSSEFRTFQLVFVHWPKIGNFKFQHRLGLEQRWFKFTDFEANKFVHRTRYRFGITSPDIFLFKSDIPFYIKGNMEFLRDLNDDELRALINSNRFMLGVGGQLNKKLRTEIQFQIMSLRDKDLRKLIQDKDLIRLRAYYQFR